MYANAALGPLATAFAFSLQRVKHTWTQESWIDAHVFLAREKKGCACALQFPSFHNHEQIGDTQPTKLRPSASAPASFSSPPRKHLLAHAPPERPPCGSTATFAFGLCVACSEHERLLGGRQGTPAGSKSQLQHLQDPQGQTIRKAVPAPTRPADAPAPEIDQMLPGTHDQKTPARETFMLEHRNLWLRPLSSLLRARWFLWQDGA